jgi:hypothetical protein
MILDIQMTLPAMVMDSFANSKGDSAVTGDAVLATRLTLPEKRTALPATWKILPTTETVLGIFELIPCV